MSYPTNDEIDQVYAEVRAGFATRKTRDIAFRKQQLANLVWLLEDNTPAFEHAIAADLGRPHFETGTLEITATIIEADLAYKNVERWAKTETLPFDPLTAAMKPVIRKEPKGVVLIIAPFNYPINLALSPMVAAIAAGNAVVLKPSELSPRCAALLVELFPKYLDPSVFRIVTGAIPETTKLLELKWDHIFYTGNNRVAKIIMTAAAKHLTPVTLELGGKSPAVIDSNCDLESAVRRMYWGKTLNAGQICMSPDYVLVQRDFQDKLVSMIKKIHKEFYPDGARASDSFGRIVSSAHVRRIRGLLDATRGRVVMGGETDEAERFIEPTVVRDVPVDDALMSQELFGPVMPIVPVDNLDEAIAIINSHDHPLALYVFTQDAKFKAKVFDNTQSGAAVANDVLMQNTVDGLPFGGIGPSGMGAYTGKFGFDTFTHLRGELDAPKWLDVAMGIRFPPYTAGKRQALRVMLRPWPLPPRDGRTPLWVRARKLMVPLAVAACAVYVARLGWNLDVQRVAGGFAVKLWMD